MLKLYKAFSLGFSAFPVQLQRLLFSATFERQPRKAVGLFSQPRNEMPDVATNGTKHANYVAGEILDERFADVFDVFRTNFENGLESEGAAFSVFFEGRLVVDLYGGFANKKHGLFWQRDTKSILFSTSKSICAIIVAHLVEKGKLSYDDKVVKFWPEFEKHGKGDITVRHICWATVSKCNNDHRRLQELVENCEDFRGFRASLDAWNQNGLPRTIDRTPHRPGVAEGRREGKRSERVFQGRNTGEIRILK
ncbi:hypothetical protein L596_015116 [Steinernema carpocapsae]|uniref:Beta-lactamase-related domain-containing protein n=1 Tax=Steinernema carpocapsae TaxID=34508 RepID=A0A4U5NEK4_STECR|nr:hypothetical protein L596_015116 [Steinernema carpocapsae]